MTPQQKDSRLTIGQRIDVVEVICSGYGNHVMPPTSHRAAIEHGIGYDVVSGYLGIPFLYLSIKDNQCRKVGTLVVTKLKGEDGV